MAPQQGVVVQGVVVQSAAKEGRNKKADETKPAKKIIRRESRMVCSVC